MRPTGMSRRIILNTLSVLFGLGAWLTTNSVFTQLPLLVQVAPEKWSLPSYLSLMVQIANIGPLIYSIFKNKIGKENVLILSTLFFATAVMIVLSIFYWYTVVVFGHEFSLPLLVLVFFLSLVCCTSALLYIPFMNRFPPFYLISYMIGEGLSGLVPSLLALFQGVGGNPNCINSTDQSGNTVLVPGPLEPSFSSATFFGAISFLMACSALAFYFLSGYLTFESTALPESFSVSEEILQPESQTVRMSRRKNVALFVAAAVLTAFSNGVLPSIQTYSSLPYGNVAYHLSLNLANMANPFACFLSFFFPITSSILLGSTLSAAFCLAGFVTAIAVMSPSPPLQHSQYGIAINVVAWIACSGSVSFAKMSIANLYRNEGKSALFWFGVAMQVGSSLGAIVIFLLINFTSLFVSYNPCRDYEWIE